MWITTATGNYFYDPHTDGEVPVLGQDWILPSGDNLGRVQSIGGVRQWASKQRRDYLKQMETHHE